MKALLGTLIVLSAASANASTAAYNQLLASFQGKDCAPALVKQLKAMTHPSTYDNWTTLGATYAQAVAIRSSVLDNVVTYRNILPTIRKNLSNGNYKANKFIYGQIIKNLENHRTDGITDEQEALSNAAVNCVYRYINLTGSTTDQGKSLDNVETFFGQIEGAVN